MCLSDRGLYLFKTFLRKEERCQFILVRKKESQGSCGEARASDIRMPLKTRLVLRKQSNKHLFKGTLRQVEKGKKPSLNLQNQEIFLRVPRKFLVPHMLHVEGPG